MPSKSNKGLQPLAMVKPPPKKSSIETQHAASLEEILQRLGNDRAYTVISHKGNSWVIHFEGDESPKTITANTN
jgi:hypothetical protein